MKVSATALPEPRLIEPMVPGDPRGLFQETWNVTRHGQHGIVLPFVQDNLSRSRQGTLGGCTSSNPTDRENW